MAAVAEAVAGAVSGLAQTGINIWRGLKEDEWNERNFDYQKALQQQIFEREDNAVQRRMADLKAAGLNPNLAAGSAANAGSVVGRANTSVKDINIGNPVGVALDMASHVAQLRAQKEQNEILGNERRESKANADMAENELALNNLELYNLLGLVPKVNLKRGKISASYDYDDNKIFQRGSGYYLGTDMSDGKGFTGIDLSIADNPLFNLFKWQIQNNQNSAALLQKMLIGIRQIRLRIMLEKLLVFSVVSVLVIAILDMNLIKGGRYAQKTSLWSPPL